MTVRADIVRDTWYKTYVNEWLDAAHLQQRRRMQRHDHFYVPMGHRIYDSLVSFFSVSLFLFPFYRPE